MADQTKNGISWTDATWNPVVGCSIVSPACTNCYAMRFADRLASMGMKPDGSGNPHLTHYQGVTTRDPTGRGYDWSKPVWTGKLVLAPDHILTAPLRWRRPRRVFVNSMSDLFHEDMPAEWIDRVFAVMALSPQHTFQILTKRPERMRRHAERRDYKGRHLALNLAAIMVATGRWNTPALELRVWPLPNVWLGVTAEDQARADERVPHLLATPAAVRFVSAEPLLGPIDLDAVKVVRAPGFFGSALGWHHRGKCHADDGLDYPILDWVIVGGESGPGARPTHPDWIRSIRDQCAAAGVAFHFKQWGEWAPSIYLVKEAAGSPRPEVAWPDGSIGAGNSIANGGLGCPLHRLGKHRAGRTLDGVIHDAFPEVCHG